MKMELIKTSHAVGESNFHLQFTPAYRRDVFKDKEVAELTLAYILEKMNKLKVTILGYGFGPDYLHLFVANVRFVSEVELVRQIKGYSSYKMRKYHWNLFKKDLWGKKFWSEGHFYRSVGAVNKVTMKHYIEESQDKHWDNRKITNQKLLDEFY